MRLSTILLIGTLAGCVSVRMGAHVAASDYAGDPRRVFVFNGLDGEFDQRVPELFGIAIRTTLAQCGVEATVYRPNSMELDADKKLRSTLVAFKPDTTLTLREIVQNRINGEVRGGGYQVTFHDTAQNRDVWKGRMGVGASSGFLADRSVAGADFATEVVRQLSADGVLKHCPPFPAKT